MPASSWAPYSGEDRENRARCQSESWSCHVDTRSSGARPDSRWSPSRHRGCDPNRLPEARDTFQGQEARKRKNASRGPRRRGKRRTLVDVSNDSQRCRRNWGFSRSERQGAGIGSGPWPFRTGLPFTGRGPANLSDHFGPNSVPAPLLPTSRLDDGWIMRAGAASSFRPRSDKSHWIGNLYERNGEPYTAWR